jgi:L-threonylcarbamoyladenylate synthase
MTSQFEAEIDRAQALLLKSAAVIVVPTDTTYGVICRLDDDAGIDRIYEIKGRDRSKPLIILGSESSDLLQWIDGDHETIHKLASKFWPGPLTIVARANASVPRGILSGGNTVGIRIPAHRGTRELIGRVPNRSVASTSANPSGAGIPKDFAEVRKLMQALVDYILPDCGEPPAGNESTIINISTDVPCIIRQGALPADEILSVL